MQDQTEEPSPTSAERGIQQPVAPLPAKPVGPLSYSRRLLLKSLLRAIALASYAPGTGARPQVWREMLDRSKALS